MTTLDDARNELDAPYASTEREAGDAPRDAPGGRKWMWLAAWPVVAVLALSNEPAPLYVLWQRQLGFSSATLTLVYAAYIAGLLGALTVAGTLSDRFGRKPVLLPGLALALVATLLFTAAHSVPALALGRLLSGIAVGAFLSAGMAAVSDLARTADRELAGLVASSSMVAGAAVGPLLAGVLSELLPWPTVGVFVLQLVLLAVAGAVVLRAPLARPVRGAGRATGRGWFRVPGVPRANRRQLLLSLAVFAPAITATGFVLSLGPSLLSELLHTDNRVVAGAMIFVLFAAATGVQFAVRAAGVGVRVAMLGGAGLTVGGMAVLVVGVAWASVPLLLTAGVLAGLGQGMTQLGGLTTLATHVPADRLAEANAALTAGGYLFAGALPVGAGYLSDAVGLTTGTAIFGAAVAALALTGALTLSTHRL